MKKVNVDLIRQSLSQDTLKSLANLEAFRKIGSTNTYLLGASRPAPGKIRVAIAAQQTAGRGRQAKEWFSPSDAGLWMSVAYTFEEASTMLSALTLAVGATLADELVNIGVAKIALKWPNDLWVDGCKLGGILLETCGGGMTAVVGIGINTALPKDANYHEKGGKMPIDLRALLPTVPSIDSIAARIIERLRSTLQEFDRNGFAPFVSEWSRFDALAGREISVQRAGVEETGFADGISSDGALLLRQKEGLRRIVSGSVRMINCEESAR